MFGFFTALGHAVHLEAQVKRVQDEELEDDEVVDEDNEDDPPSSDVEDSPPGGDGPDEEMTKSELDYLKAQLIFYRDEKVNCEAKMSQPYITMENYTILKKYWDGLETMIIELEDIIG